MYLDPYYDKNLLHFKYFSTHSTSNRNQITVIIRKIFKIDENFTLLVRPDSCRMYILSAHFLYHVAILPKFGPLANRIIDHANARDPPNQIPRENILDPRVRIYSFTRFVKWEVEHYGRKKNPHLLVECLLCIA